MLDDKSKEEERTEFKQTNFGKSACAQAIDILARRIHDRDANLHTPAEVVPEVDKTSIQGRLRGSQVGSGSFTVTIQ